MAKGPGKKLLKKPTYLRGRKPVKIKLHDVFELLSMIDDHKQKVEFMAAAKEIDAHVMVHAKTVNFVKDFIASHPVMSELSLGAQIVNPGARTDPYECLS